MIISSTTGVKTYTSKTYIPKEKETNNNAFHTTKDTVSLGSDIDNSNTYSKVDRNKLNSSDLEKIKAQVDQATSALRRIVETLILKQGKIKDSLNINYSISYNSEDVKEAVSDDGDWGVEAVSDRIVDFAKAISGGDRSKLAEITAAIDKGFKQASKSLGGELPDICNKTYDRIMKKLDDWKNEM